jgi:RHS repeat-associated protein
LYNDKELWEEADLNWYDYGFRNYDPQIGRFPQLDPLTFDYPYLTPFQYASCDPITNIDVDGLEGANALKCWTAAGVGAGAATSGAKAAGTGVVRAIAVQGAQVGANAISQSVQSTSFADQAINQAFKNAPKVIATGVMTKASLTALFTLIPLQAGNAKPDGPPPPGMKWGGDMYIRDAPITWTDIEPNPNPSPIPAPSNKDGDGGAPRKFWVTYTKAKINPDGTRTVYSGRTSGMYASGVPTDVDADMAVKLRDMGHAILRGEGYGDAAYDRYSVNYAAIRGREQQLIDYNGGVQSEGGFSRNKIRAVGRRNVNRFIYQAASIAAFGALPSKNPADK